MSRSTTWSTTFGFATLCACPAHRCASSTVNGNRLQTRHPCTKKDALRAPRGRVSRRFTQYAAVSNGCQEPVVAMNDRSEIRVVERRRRHLAVVQQTLARTVLLASCTIRNRQTRIKSNNWPGRQAGRWHAKARGGYRTECWSVLGPACSSGSAPLGNVEAQPDNASKANLQTTSSDPFPCGH